MSKSQVLHDSIETLYATFSSYSLPTSTDFCPCCHDSNADAPLRAKPLRQLGWEELGLYVSDALLTWGDVGLYKHFLPRILELMVTMPDETWIQVDTEVIFSKFRHGEWRVWPKEERGAIESFLHAMWKEVLSDPPSDGNLPDIETWVVLHQSVRG